MEQRPGLKYGLSIQESRKKVGKAPGGHTQTTKLDETSFKILPKDFQNSQEMKKNLKCGSEKNASFPVSDDNASNISAPHRSITNITRPKTSNNDKTHLPHDKANIATNKSDVNDDTKYDQRVEMSSTTLTEARPKTKRNDKTHLPYDKANIATNKSDVNDDTKYDQRVEMSSTILTGVRPKTRRNDKTQLPYDKANIATNKSDINDDTKYDHRVEMSSTTLTEDRPKTRRNDKTHLPYDKANIATNKSDVNDDTKYDHRVEMSSTTSTEARPKTRRNDKTHLPYDKGNIATNKSDVNDDTKYDLRVEMPSTSLTGARPKTRTNDKTHLPYDKANIATNKSDVNEARPKTFRNDAYCISGNEAYVIDNSAGHRGDRTYTKKNDIGQEPVVVITMNTNGQNEKKLEEPQDKRREVITKLLKIYTPAIMFCQEFQSENINGRVWSKYGINSNYIFYGNKEGNILAHKKLDIHLSVDGEQINTVLRRILEGLQRSSNNVLNKTFPLDFDPLSRMCMCFANIKLKDGNTRMLLCASWHGWWNKKTREDRIEFFKYLMEFLRKVFKKFKRPLIIGGDFNIDIFDVKEIVNDPFSLGMYVPSKRRKDKEKDFFIVSKNLRLENIQCIDYKEDADFGAMWKNKVDEYSTPNDILDHDPIKATLKFT